MKRTIKFIFLTLFMWIALSALSTVNAASATIKSNKTSAEVGDSVTVTVTVNAAAWNLKVSGSASGDIIGYNSDAENQTTTKKYTVDTSKAGTYKVTLSGDITDETKDAADSINTSVTITVKAKTTTTDKDTTTDKNTSTTNKDTTTTKEKSSNAYLKTLGVRISESLAKELGVKTDEYDFSGFSKTKTSYNVTVPKNVDSLKVVATAGENGTVKVSGNSGFEVGSDNKITVKVTAEDGKTTKTYTIKVTQLAEEEEKPGNVIEEDEEGIYLKKLSIEGIELLPEFAKDTYSYTATLSDSNTSEVKVNAEANNENVKIDISGNTNLVEGENTINILLTLEDSAVQTVYQIVVTKVAAEVPVITTEGNNTSTTDLIGTIKNYAGVAIAVIALIVLAVIVLIILLVKENKKLKEDDEEIEQANTEEYNVYRNDENEFANNDSKKDNFIESLYKQRNGNLDNEDLTEDEKETLEEINKQTEEIFREKVEGQSVEYTSNEEIMENPLETRKRRRGKGKHSL